MRKLILTIIRISLTIVILIFVWLNAHWAVALLLTLASIRFECEDYIKSMSVRIILNQGGAYEIFYKKVYT